MRRKWLAGGALGAVVVVTGLWLTAGGNAAGPAAPKAAPIPVRIAVAATSDSASQIRGASRSLLVLLPGHSLAPDLRGILMDYPFFNELLAGVEHAACDAGLQPALSLLVHRLPRRKFMRDQPPGGTCTRHPAQCIEHQAQVVLALPGMGGHQSQIGRGKRPFFIGNIGGIRAGRLHPATIAATGPSS